MHVSRFVASCPFTGYLRNTTDPTDSAIAFAYCSRGEPRFATRVVAPVLLNDAEAIKATIAATPSMLQHRTTLVSAFTSLVGVSLLHVAAEYGNFDAALRARRSGCGREREGRS